EAQDSSPRRSIERSEPLLRPAPIRRPMWLMPEAELPEAFEESAPEAEPAETPPETAVPPAVAEARFTAFLPRQAAVERWHSLLVYAHTPEMLDQIRSDAKRFLPELGGAPREVRAAQATVLARGTPLTFTPYAEGVLFNPESITIAWWEDLHRLEFRFKAEAALLNQAVNLTITVSADPLIVAQLRGGIVFESPESAYKPNPYENEPITAAPYHAEEIFVSYSRRDSEIAKACRNAYRALGFKVLMDVDELRAGERWDHQLERLIERATIFQLFWSENSAQSQFCRREWQYALQLAHQRNSDGSGYIRPVYWQEPMPQPPKELEHLHFAYVRLPRLSRHAD
ncbi:MAG: hypothetical protein CUN49_09965, partial [Candidatus Thermofonsia Clade 1 bacterium]